MNITIKGKIQQSQHLYKPEKMKGMFANYFVLGKCILNIMNHAIFSHENANI
jgi:hypothetical protein